MRFEDRLNDKEFTELRKYIATILDQKIEIVTHTKLDEWFHANIKQLVDDAIKEAFKKIMLVKFE